MKALWKPHWPGTGWRQLSLLWHLSVILVFLVKAWQLTESSCSSLSCTVSPVVPLQLWLSGSVVAALVHAGDAKHMWTMLLQSTCWGLLMGLCTAQLLTPPPCKIQENIPGLFFCNFIWFYWALWLYHPGFNSIFTSLWRIVVVSVAVTGRKARVWGEVLCVCAFCGEEKKGISFSPCSSSIEQKKQD